MATIIWHERAGELTATPLASLMWMDASGEMDVSIRPHSVVIAPVSQFEGALAAAIVPDDCAGRVVLNGTPLAAGLAAVRHADCLAFDRHKLWTSGESQPEETEYSPARHSADVFCFLTKARLREGELITICPGPPGKPCGMIYKRAAWQTVMTQSGRFRCPNCSFDPKLPRWAPALSTTRRSLDDVFRMLNRESDQ